MARKTRGSPPPGGTPRTDDTAPAGSEDTFDQVEETAPVTVSPHLLNPNHQRFCEEYITDLSGPDAYQRTYPYADRSTAYSNSHKLLKDAQIRGQIQRLLDERATLTGITADRVLVSLWELSAVDPNEVVQVRVGCCRHCWGQSNGYQRTRAEYDRDQREHIAYEIQRERAEKDDFVPAQFDEQGGIGFDANRPPNPLCPECFGDGEPRAVIQDTTKMSPAALRLFNGIKYDKSGRMSMVFADRLAALKLVGEHLGLWSDKFPGPQTVDPLQALLAEIHARHGAALPVIAHDPEAKTARPAPPPEGVQDVQPKAPAKKPVKGWRVTK